MKRIAVLAAVSAAVLTAPPLAAQQTDRGSPLWGSFAVGQSTMGICHGEYLLSCNYTKGQTARSLHGSFGTRFDERMLVGLEVSRWGVQRGMSEVKMLTAGPLVHLYPRPELGLNLKLAVGMTSLKLEGREDDMLFAEEHLGGFALVGAGYDITVNPLLTVRPGIDYRYSTFAGDAFRSTANLLEASVGVRLNWPPPGARSSVPLAAPHGAGPRHPPGTSVRTPG